MKPFTLSETSPGQFSLLLTSFAPADEVFAACGQEGGGFGWEAVARKVLAEQPALEDRVAFDPEPDQFCAYGPEREPLAQLGALLAALFHAPDALRALLGEQAEDL